MKRLSKHLSFANAMSCIAVFVAMSGAAYAATTLGKKSVKTQNLANGAVTTLKLRGGSVTNLKLRNGAVTGAKIANGTIGATQLANGAVRSAQLGGGVVTEGKLKDAAVTEKKLAANAVGTTKLTANAVSTAKLQDGAVSGAKLAPSLLASLLKNVSYVTKTSSSNSSEATKTATASCPSGKQAIGGGAQIVGDTTTVAITRSAPATDAIGTATGPVSWSGTASAISAEGNPWAVEVLAVCAEF